MFLLPVYGNIVKKKKRLMYFFLFRRRADDKNKPCEFNPSLLLRQKWDGKKQKAEVVKSSGSICFSFLGGNFHLFNWVMTGKEQNDADCPDTESSSCSCSKTPGCWCGTSSASGCAGGVWVSSPSNTTNVLCAAGSSPCRTWGGNGHMLTGLKLHMWRVVSFRLTGLMI